MTGPPSGPVSKHVAILKSLMTSAIKRLPGSHRKISAIMKDRQGRHVLRHPFKSATPLRRDIIGWHKISMRMIQHVLQK
jgi:hypothetical protein